MPRLRVVYRGISHESLVFFRCTHEWVRWVCIPRKYKSVQENTRVCVYTVELHWSIGRFGGTPTNRQRLCCILISCILYSMVWLTFRVWILREIIATKSFFWRILCIYANNFSKGVWKTRIANSHEERIVRIVVNSSKYVTPSSPPRNIVESDFPAKKHRRLSGQKVFLNIISPVFTAVKA